jgi:hypothetical protein
MWYKKGEGVVPNYDGPILAHFENGSIETIHAQDFINGHCEYNVKITHWMLVPEPPTAEIAEGANLQHTTPQGMPPKIPAAPVA